MVERHLNFFDPEYARYKEERFLDYLDGACTLGMIGLCQMPVLISRARRDSILCQFQVIGFPFNMTEKFMADHLSFSPRNCEDGRYYSLATAVLNHADMEHCVANLKIIGPCGMRIHSAVGRFHTIMLFIGAGIAGNLCAWLQYVVQKYNWRGILPPPRQWLGGSLGGLLDSVQTSSLDYIYSSVNSWRPVLGASGAGMGFLAMDTCICCMMLKNKIKQFLDWRRQGNTRNVDSYYEFLAWATFLYDISQIVFAGLVVAYDTHVFVRDIDPAARGTFGQMIAYSMDHVCHSGHLGGFLFGLAYFYFLKKFNRIKGTDKSFFFYLLQHANRHRF